MNNNLKKELEKLQYILKVDNINKEDIIINTQKNDDIIKKYFNNYFIKRDDLLKKIKENKNSEESILKARDETGKIKIYNSLFKIFTGKDTYKYINLDENNNSKNLNDLYYNFFFASDFSKISDLYNKSELYVYDCYKKLINNLPELYLHLNKNGNSLFMYVYPSYDIINFILLCTLLFDEVYLLHRYMIFCRKFKNDIKKLKIITDIIQNNYKFEVKNNKKNSEKIFYYLKNHIIIDYEFKSKLILNKNKELYSYYFQGFIIFIQNIGLNSIDFIKKDLKSIQKIIPKKNKIKTYDENYFIDLLNKNKVKNILSIGIIDINIDNINKKIIKIDNKKINMIINLNKLFENKYKFDCIFLNNINNFNDLLFYAIFLEKLLSKNSLLIINNAHFEEINKCIIHIEETMENYKKIDSPANYAIFKFD